MKQTLEQAPTAPTLKQAFWYWLKLGFISFGGPAGQIAVMHHDLVENKRWISEKRFLHALNYCMALPGPEAQQLATYIGWLMHRRLGGVIAGGLFVLPSLLILMLLSYVYMRFGEVPAIAGVLYGIKPAVVAIVLFAAYRIGVRTLKNGALWSIAAASFVAIAILKLPFPLIVLSAAIAGFMMNRYRPVLLASGGGHAASQKSYGKSVIDDDTPTPSHARFSVKGLVKFIVVGIAIWLAGMLLLILRYGWDATLTQMAWFFTKAALLTFGGAYAVLPYVFQGAVTHYGWLSAAQMMDGLALGETTPGPLIMVVAFVGFVGGWSHVPLADPLVAGIIAACVVTFFTFLPSFIFIFAGAPLIESTQDNLKLTAPLTAITAAVVGVIASLAVFFSQHIFWQGGLEAGTDWIALIATLAAGFILVKFKLNIIKLIGIFALLGLIHHWLI